MQKWIMIETQCRTCAIGKIKLLNFTFFLNSVQYEVRKIIFTIESVSEREPAIVQINTTSIEEFIRITRIVLCTSGNDFLEAL